MYIKRIKIKNYKKLEDFDFEFSQMNAIIGKNNSGKSTLLNVIKAFLDNDTSIFKNYIKSESIQDLVVEVDTNLGAYYLDTSRSTLKWMKIGEFNDENRGDYGYLPDQPKLDDLVKLLNSGVAGYIENEYPDLANDLREALSTFELLTDINETEIINEEDTNYDFDFKVDFKKAIAMQFKDRVDSITRKGLGQQKEFVLRQFSGGNYENGLQTSILIIDEIENSLSMEATCEIVKSLKKNDFHDELDNSIWLGEEQQQVFYTTHNANAIVKETHPSIITLGPVPGKILNHIVLDTSVFVEGPSDAKILGTYYTNYDFFPSGGNNIVSLYESLISKGLNPKMIVDGDTAGSNYKLEFDRIRAINNTHQLQYGTIEDYVLEDEKRNIISSTNTISLIIPTPFPDNFIENFIKPKYALATSASGLAGTDLKALKSTYKGEMSTIKSTIQTGNIDVAKLRSDLDAFLP